MHIEKEIIIGYFEGRTSPIQRSLIDDWIAEDPRHLEFYYQCLEEWENQNIQYEVEADEAFGNYQAYLRAPIDDRPEVESASTLNYRMWPRHSKVSAYVAAIAVLLLCTWLVLNRVAYIHYRTNFGQVSHIVLPDGSRVKLNTNSELRVPRWGFGSKSRKVFLSGEANFEVTHLADHQNFIVNTDKDFQVKVLGTEFTMYARKHGARVILNKGKVQVLYKQDNAPRQVTMKPGELVSFNDQNQLQIRTTKRVRDYQAWEEKRFVFEETSLEEVAYLLQENYGFQVEIKSKELSERVLMGSFRAENADELLRSISELLDINVVRQGNKVQLSDR